MSASPDPKCSLPGSAASGSGGGGASTGLLRGYKQAQIDANGSSSLPRRRPGLVGMTPSPEVISAALDRKQTLTRDYRPHQFHFPKVLFLLSNSPKRPISGK